MENHPEKCINFESSCHKILSCNRGASIDVTYVSQIVMFEKTSTARCYLFGSCRWSCFSGRVFTAALTGSFTGAATLRFTNKLLVHLKVY